MDENSLEPVPPHELEEKRKEARRALSSLYKEIPERSADGDNITQKEIPSTPKEPGAQIDEQGILEQLTPQELSEKRLAAKKALGDTTQKRTNAMLSENIAILSKEAISRASEFARHITEQKKEDPLPTPPKSYEKATSKDATIPEKTQIRTKNTDLGQQRKEGSLSLAQIAIEQQKLRRAHAQKEAYQKTGRFQNIVLVASIVFIALGAGIISYYAFIQEDVVTIPQLPEGKTYIIAPDSERRIDVGSKSALATRNEFTNIMREGLANETVQSIAFVDAAGEEISSKNVFTTLGLFPPDTLSRTLKDEYMIGIYSDSRKESFLVFSVISFENALSALLSWEKTTLPTLAPLLSTKEIRQDSRTFRWEDDYIKNRDVRLLKDNVEDVFIVYSFLDKETLVITGGIDSFTEITTRFTTPPKVLQ